MRQIIMVLLAIEGNIDPLTVPIPIDEIHACLVWLIKEGYIEEHFSCYKLTEKGTKSNISMQIGFLGIKKPEEPDTTEPFTRFVPH